MSGRLANPAEQPIAVQTGRRRRSSQAALCTLSTDTAEAGGGAGLWAGGSEGAVVEQALGVLAGREQDGEAGWEIRQQQQQQHEDGWSSRWW